MKQQDKVKYQELSIAELKAEVVKLEVQMVDLSMKKHLTQLKNVRQPKSIRHDVARLRSIIRNKELIQSAAKTADVRE